MPNKKADFLTMDNIAIAILVLILLIVLLAIVRGFFSQSAIGIKQIGEEALEESKGERCRTVFGVERACYSECPETKSEEAYKYEPVYRDFVDCPQKLPKGGFKTDKEGRIMDKCCERIKG